MEISAAAGRAAHLFLDFVGRAVEMRNDSARTVKQVRVVGPAGNKGPEMVFAQVKTSALAAQAPSR